jgi:hypothetical protein
MDTASKLFLFLTLFCIILYIAIMRMTETYDVDDDQNIYNYTYNKPLAMGITFITFVIGSILIYNFLLKENFRLLRESLAKIFKESEDMQTEDMQKENFRLLRESLAKIFKEDMQTNYVYKPYLTPDGRTLYR